VDAFDGAMSVVGEFRLGEGLTEVFDEIILPTCDQPETIVHFGVHWFWR